MLYSPVVPGALRLRVRLLPSPLEEEEEEECREVVTAGAPAGLIVITVRAFTLSSPLAPGVPLLRPPVVEKKVGAGPPAARACRPLGSPRPSPAPQRCVPRRRSRIPPRGGRTGATLIGAGRAAAGAAAAGGVTRCRRHPSPTGAGPPSWETSRTTRTTRPSA